MSERFKIGLMVCSLVGGLIVVRFFVKLFWGF
jgi:hypothetical protein